MSHSARALVAQARNCQACKPDLPYPPRPIFMFAERAPLLILGQAPGKIAHTKGIAWADASGARLRAWLGLSEQQFYRQGLVNVLPMSFCFPGYQNGADAPPIKACSEKWHAPFLDISQPKLTLCVGRYSQAQYMPEYRSLTTAVEAWESELNKGRIALPHPSGRNNRWLAKHPWFERTTLPAVRRAVADVVSQFAAT